MYAYYTLGAWFSCCKGKQEEEEEYVPRNKLANQSSWEKQYTSPTDRDIPSLNKSVKIRIYCLKKYRIHYEYAI